MSKSTVVAAEEKQGVARWVCCLFGAAALAAGLIHAWMSVRYGQRMTVDAEGWWTQGGGILTISALGFAFALAGGGLVKRKRCGPVCGGLLLLALAGIFMSFTVSNSTGFAGYQVLSKVRVLEEKKQTAKDIADLQNQTTLKEREELRKELFRSYVISKGKDGKGEALTQIEQLTSKPVELQAPKIDTPAVADPRAEVLHQVLGWNVDRATALSAAMLPLLLVVGELLGAFLATALWSPGQPASTLGVSTSLPEDFRKPSKQEAKNDLLQLVKQGREPCVAECAERWGVWNGTASKWMDDFAQDGWMRKVQSGHRKIAVAASRPGANGSAQGRPALN